jgi:hypothetical protein
MVSPAIQQQKIPIGKIDWIILLPLFIMTATPVESSGGAGVATLIRTLSAMLFLLVMSQRLGVKLSQSCLLVVVELTFYFIAINIPNFTYFAVMATMCMTWGLMVAYMAEDRWREWMDFYIRSYLVFNMIGLAIAIAAYVGTGQILDLHKLVFPFSEARVAIFMDRVRLSGFHIEPGTYSNMIYMMILLRALLLGRIYNRLNLLAMLSTLATFAAWAAVAVSFVCVGMIFEFFIYNPNMRPSVRAVILIVFGSIALITLPIVMPNLSDLEYVDYFAKRFSGEHNTGSSVDKIMALDAWQDKLGFRMLIGTSLPDSFCPICEAEQDLGTFFSMAYYVGILPTIALIAASAIKMRQNWNIAFGFAAIPTLVSKLYFYDPILWLIIGVLIFSATKYKQQPAG